MWLVDGTIDWCWRTKATNLLRERSGLPLPKFHNRETKESRKVILEWEENPMELSSQGITKAEDYWW